MGMNFHYLPPLLRFRLLERMKQQQVIEDLIVKQRFEVNYDDVKSIKDCKTNNQKIFVCICVKQDF